MENEKELRILDAAKKVFVRYGFRRVTMQDVADEAGISRPALYLVFPNKEEIFKAAARQMASESLSIIRQGIERLTTSEEKLNFAFEVWSIRPFEMMLASPDARELIECGLGFAKETIDLTYRDFGQLLEDILQPIVEQRGNKYFNKKEIAKIMSAAIHGFKGVASSIEELRAMIAGLVRLTLAALQAPA